MQVRRLLQVFLVCAPQALFGIYSSDSSREAQRQATLSSFQLPTWNITEGFLNCCNPHFHPWDEGSEHLSSHKSWVWKNVPLVRLRDEWARSAPPSIHTLRASDEMHSASSLLKLSPCRKVFRALHSRQKVPAHTRVGHVGTAHCLPVPTPGQQGTVQVRR